MAKAEEPKKPRSEIGMNRTLYVFFSMTAVILLATSEEARADGVSGLSALAPFVIMAAAVISIVIQYFFFSFSKLSHWLPRTIASLIGFAGIVLNAVLVLGVIASQPEEHYSTGALIIAIVPSIASGVVGVFMILNVISGLGNVRDKKA